ncbi:MAG: hypothetical protein HKN88_01985 [Gammaproteobacteria bacterium]|nr:hypothetical protein [Gammaproteobacteria bacterium]NNC96821.1 hypothetical protein [Gammaproteobacteria bacterium]NNM12889.1 hypothetical protein [Gammaproteobacteria bacterium]
MTLNTDKQAKKEQDRKNIATALKVLAFALTVFFAFIYLTWKSNNGA